jgi:hypothetical protein
MGTQEPELTATIIMTGFCTRTDMAWTLVEVLEEMQPILKWGEVLLTISRAKRWSMERGVQEQARTIHDMAL